MYPIPPTETLVQTKTCRHCSASFPITDKDLEFYEKVSPVFSGKRYSIPAPTLCPDCRQQQRYAFRNERNLYRRTCGRSWEGLISMHKPDTKFPVYKNEVWWWDSWDALSFGTDYQFDTPFFTQFQNLLNVVPRLHTFNYSEDRMLNSVYTNCAGDLKNCHLIFWAIRDEDCYYCSYTNDSKNCIDCHFVFNSENCYNCVDLLQCYDLVDSRVCQDCSNGTWMKDCINCHDCIGCVGLRNAQYSILNKPYTKEEFHAKKEQLEKENFQSIKKELQYLFSSFPNKYFHGQWNENVSWDYISNSKNCHNCFDTFNSEDCKNCSWFADGKTSHDFFAWWEAELCYQVVSGWDKHQHCSFTNASWGCTDCYYNDLCMYCKNCFGCVWLKNKSYCILNKQYTKDEYEVLVPKIIEHMMKPLPRPPVPMGVSGTPSNEGECEWGEFFPSSLSPFGYNETVAQEYYPLTREEVLSPLSSEGEGSGVRFNWSDYEPPFPRVEKIIPADKLPDDITKIPDDILNWAIECEVTKKPFRIIKQELEFYRKHHLPIPRRHPDQRHLDRMALRNPRKLFERKCDKCGTDMVTTYSPERKERVYCESCYNAEVVW